MTVQKHTIRITNLKYTGKYPPEVASGVQTPSFSAVGSTTPKSISRDGMNQAHNSPLG